jgi:O-antigen ligase
MDINHLLAIGAIPIFIVLLYFQPSRKTYIFFVLYAFPVMDLAITPVELGRLRVFDFVSFIYLFSAIPEFLQFNKRLKPYSALFIVLLVALIFGSLNSLYLQSSILSTIAIFPIFIFSRSVIAELFADNGFKFQLLKALKIGAVISVAFLIIQMIIGLKFTFYPMLNKNTEGEGIIRYPSYFHDPQMYGQYLVMIAFVFLINYKQMLSHFDIFNVLFKEKFLVKSVEITEPSWKEYLIFTLPFFAILQTGGRSALLAFVIGLVFLFFVLGTQYKLILAGIVTIGIGAALFLADDLTVLKRAGQADEDYAFRAALWDEAAQIFKEHPLIGIGSGNFKQYNMAFSSNYSISEEREVIFFGYGQPESGYWMLLTENGAIGTICIFLFILVPVFTSLRNYSKGQTDRFIFLIIAGLLSWLVTFASAYSLYDKRIVIVLTTFVCLLILESNKRKSQYEVAI